jgi:biotin carboxyl carrier protein
MKMEVAVQAEVGGRVKAVEVSEGTFVDEDARLVELE